MELSGPIFALIMGIIVALIVLGIVINYVYILFVENPRREGHSKTFMEKVAINWRDFKRFIWDIKKGEIFGRTPLSWFLIIVYLAFLYTIVFGLFALLLWLRLRYLPDLKDGPYRTDYLTFDGPGIILNEILIFSKVNRYCDERIILSIFIFYMKVGKRNGRNV